MMYHSFNIAPRHFHSYHSTPYQGNIMGLASLHLEIHGDQLMKLHPEEQEWRRDHHLVKPKI